MQTPFTRRHFLGTTAALAPLSVRASIEAPALLGGKPVRSGPFPGWPVIGDNDIKGWVDVLRSGIWNRLNGDLAARFETAWAERLGCRHALATSSGTTALFAALNALEVGPGDEVIVPPYTFVATINVVLLQHALPVFVDTDRETFQIDATKIDAAVTDKTRCLMPVHLGGAAADLDTILEVGKKRNVPVIEDACQSHLAEWRGKKVGTLGAMGCFSFQASKNLNSGEGGAVVGDDESLLASCRGFHNNGRGVGGYARNGCNLRLTEFQAALLLSQLTRLEDQSRTRERNAAYLTGLLRDIPGITPARMYEGCTRNAYHLYMFRYDPKEFDGMPRSQFLRALSAEGIPASGGYTPLNREPFLKATLQSRAYRAAYPSERLNEAIERMQDCPSNDALCEEAVWLTQTMLLGPKGDMDQIAEAVRKVQAHAGKLNGM